MEGMIKEIETPTSEDNVRELEIFQFILIELNFAYIRSSRGSDLIGIKDGITEEGSLYAPYSLSRFYDKPFELCDTVDVDLAVSKLIEMKLIRKAVPKKKIIPIQQYFYVDMESSFEYLKSIGFALEYHPKGDKLDLLGEVLEFTKGDNQLVPFHNVIRVQSNYYYKYDDSFERMTKESVKDDYGNDSIGNVRRFRQFKNMPSHTNWKESDGLYYNMYSKLSRVPVKGNWDNIDKMIKHIFRGEHYNMFMTYAHVLYTRPTHALPAIGFVGKQNTGKSKFLELVLEMFENNGKALDAEDILADFNESFINKLVIVIDEKLGGRDRSKMMNKLKKLITGGTHNLKKKHVDDTTIKHYGKYLMASNDTESMLALETENTRFWIIEVPVLESDDPDIFEKAVEEIPAFFHYIQHEYKPIDRAGRLWLDPKTFQTDAAKEMQKGALPVIVRNLASVLDDYFVEHDTVEEITFSANMMIPMLPSERSAVSPTYLTKMIKQYWPDKKMVKSRILNPFLDYHVDPKNVRNVTFNRADIKDLLSKYITEDDEDQASEIIDF